MVRLARVVLASLCVSLMLISAALGQVDEAAQVLQRIQQAAQRLDYQGVFAYQQNGQMQSFRITHRYDGVDEDERLEALDNLQREFFRKNDVVRCLIPDRKLVLIEPKRQARFPALLMTNPVDFSKHYDMVREPEIGRVAGRSCVNLEIAPKDDLRPHFRLCADEHTGLLLKAQVLDPSGRVSQQVSFTQVDIGLKIDDAAFESPWSTDDWTVIDSEQQTIDVKPLDWKYRVPTGYQLSQHAKRLFQDGREVNQIILTDGLASISIFIEPYQESLSQHHSTGLRHIGSANLYGKRVENFWVMIVGEVPTKAIQIVADSISRTEGR